MDDTAKRRSDDLTEQAISAGPLEDFRESYRARLRWLKENQPSGFTEALSHYNDILVANIAAGNDPIREWLEYGQLLGELSGPGRSVRIDETGRARPFNGETDGLILYVPDDTGVPALALAVPREISDAQQATLALLAPRRQAAE